MDREQLADAIRSAQKGDAASMDRLVDHLAGRIYGYLYRMSGSRHDAEDLLQEVFLRVVRMLRAYTHDGRFEAWVFRIATNLLRDRVRRIQRAPKAVGPAAGQSDEGGPDAPTDMMDDEAAPDEEVGRGVLHAEEMDALNAALTALPDPEREVIMLRHFSQMSFREIAELMNTPLGTALARAHRGLAKLRRLMNAEEAAEAPPVEADADVLLNG